MSKELLYSRGFIGTDAKRDIAGDLGLKGWKKIIFYDLAVYFDARIGMVVHQRDDMGVLVLGTVLDPLNYLIDTDEIARRLVGSARKSDVLFLDYLDTLSGRFVLFLWSNGACRVFQDSTGSRSVFYDIYSKNVFISSHAEIIARANGYRPGKDALAFIKGADFRNNKNRYFPGLSTPYKEVKALTPNTELDLKERRVSRFFPRHDLQPDNNKVGLVEDMAQFLENQMNLLSSKYDLALSLTAGLDSRLSFACTREIKDRILYYTMNYGGDSEGDAMVARDLCDKLDLEHAVIEVGPDVDDEFLKVFLQNTSHMSSSFRGRIAQALCENYPGKRLHIKSNVSEICRAYYRQAYGLLPNQPSVDLYSKLYRTGKNTAFVRCSFAEFVEETALKTENIFNYDHLDLFYWEDRIGRWQGLCLYEWDMAQDTFIPYGNRYLIKKMLSASLKDRLNGSLYYDVINALWPEARSVPVNPFEKRRKFNDAIRVARGVKLRLGA